MAACARGRRGLALAALRGCVLLPWAHMQEKEEEEAQDRGSCLGGFCSCLEGYLSLLHLLPLAVPLDRPHRWFAPSPYLGLPVQPVQPLDLPAALRLYRTVALAGGDASCAGVALGLESGQVFCFLTFCPGRFLLSPFCLCN